MATTNKAISTISYNTPVFLRDILERLLQQDIIKFYSFIVHKGEGQDKDHIHLYVEPYGRVDLAQFKKLFNELDPSNLKPLGVKPWERSKLEDWVMYSLHDEDYLKTKHETKEFHYQTSDFITSDMDTIESTFNEWHSVKHYANKNEEIVDLLQQCNMNALQVALQTGYNITQIKQLQEAMREQWEIKRTHVQSVEEQNALIENYLKMGVFQPGDVYQVAYIDENTGEQKYRYMIYNKPIKDLVPIDSDDLPY